MKKYITIIVIIILILMGLFISTILNPMFEQFLQNRTNAVSNDLEMRDSIPNDFKDVFKLRDKSKLISTGFTSDRMQYPIVYIEFDAHYDLILLRQNVHPNDFRLTDFVKLSQPIKYQSLNTRQYHQTTGFYRVNIALENKKIFLDSILITYPLEASFYKIVDDPNCLAFQIKNCKFLNLYYQKGNNPDVIFELSGGFGKKLNSDIGLLIKRHSDKIYFLWISPKDDKSPALSMSLINQFI